MGVLDDFIGDSREEVKSYMSTLEDMLSDYDRYGYAEDTLLGIYTHLESYGKISEGQIRAVENIKSKPSRKKHGW